jgi:hypothetical protein
MSLIVKRILRSGNSGEQDVEEVLSIIKGLKPEKG